MQDDLDQVFAQWIRMRHIRELLAIAKLKSISRAASVLHVSQPAVSKTLAELEARLHVRLFDRTPRGLVPTDAGESVLRHCRAIESELRKAGDDLRAYTEGAGGQVAVGAFLVALPHILPRAIALLRQRAPRVHVRVVEGNARQLESSLISGELDMVVGRLTGTNEAGLLQRDVLSSESIVIIGGAAHPLAPAKDLRCGQLSDYPWIFPAPDSVAWTAIFELFRDNGLGMPRADIESVSFPLIRTVLQDQRTLATMPSQVVAHDVALGQLAILPLALPHAVLPVGLIHRAGHEQSPASNLFMACLREAVAL